MFDNDCPLPRTFEEFNERRKASFIHVKDFKQAGNRLIGYLCTISYFLFMLVPFTAVPSQII